MIIPIEISSWYQTYQDKWANIDTRVHDAIYSYCSKQGYPVYGRVKTIESVVEKLESGRYRDWNALDDMVAYSIIIPDMSRESSVIDFLDEVFVRRELRMRGVTRKRPSEYRFDTPRFIGSLRVSPGLESEFIARGRFEIQIRTAFEHAWQVATHDQAYKHDDVSWKRLRLAAQVRAAIEQLDLLVANYEATSNFILASPDSDTDNRKTVVDLFKELFETKMIPDFAAPKDWSRFADNLLNFITNSKSKQEEIQEFLRVSLQQISTSVTLGDANSFPKSLTLFQYCMAVLTTNGIFPKNDRARLPITAELVSLYPKIEDVKGRFDFAFDD